MTTKAEAMVSNESLYSFGQNMIYLLKQEKSEGPRRVLQTGQGVGSKDSDKLQGQCLTYQLLAMSSPGINLNRSMNLRASLYSISDFCLDIPSIKPSAEKGLCTV